MAKGLYRGCAWIEKLKSVEETVEKFEEL